MPEKIFCFGVAFGLFPDGVKIGLIFLNCMLYCDCVVLLFQITNPANPAPAVR